MRLLIFVLLLFSMIPMVGAELHDGWIMDRHDSQRSGVSSSDAPDTAYVLWKLEIPYTNLVNSPLGTADRIVVRTSRNFLLCIDMNGKEVWRFNKRIDSVIVIENSVIISEGTNLWCLSLEDGSLIWKSETTVNSGIPLLTEDEVCFSTFTLYMIDPIWIRISKYVHKLFFGCENCKITCHNIQNGKRTSIMNVKDNVFSTAFNQGRFIVLSKNGNIYSLDENTKEQIWNFESKEKAHSFPVLHDNQIIFSSDSHVFCLDYTTGQLLWKFPVSKGSSPAVAYGKVFVSSHDGFLFCIDEYTGELLWKISVWHDSPVDYWVNISLSSPAVADGKVFVGSSDKNMYAFNVDDGTILWKYTVGGPVVASPAIIDGKIFVASVDGFLYAFGIDPETYIQKAYTYLEHQEFEKSYKYFIKAKEWYQEKGDYENVDLCEEYITVVEKEIQEYSLVSDILESAQNYFDTGNEFLLWKKYDDALESFTLSLELYEKIGNEKGINRCNQRIEYIREKTKENEKVNFNMIIFLFVIIFALLCITFLKRKNN